ncbi:unnamed protein product [Paramecium sonneborni]|uniref:Uncharacterized protein n=1 Tax=Paramecium sonneborni TaxID=65129 RepID=A0A8S1RJP1_9CILI|nr:unnamed protein product [Paramecium sonneborni]CAD8128446.1 unnamed protein product [Paramecium sonneborni]
MKMTGQIIYDLDSLFDESQVMIYYKPHVRGLFVDFDKFMGQISESINYQRLLNSLYILTICP